MPDYGASEFGGATAGESAAASAGSYGAGLSDLSTATAGTDVGATAGTGGTLAGGTGEFATGVTAADVAAPTLSTAGTEAGLAAGTGGTLAGGTGEFAPGVTASDVAMSNPGLWQQITATYNAASPYFDTARQVLNTVNMLRPSQSGAGTPARGASNTPSLVPLATSTPASQNQMTRDDYIKQQEAYWQNLLAAQGNNLPGNQLPPNIQDMIRRQSSLYPA